MIEHLDWDSEFLGFKTAMIHCENNNEVETWINKARNENYRLLYVFGNDDLWIDATTLQKNSGKLVDRKVVYELDTTTSAIANFEKTALYTSDTINNDLLKLAYESGKYSRFKTDTHFAAQVFEKMYELWMLNSANGKMADAIYTVEENSKTLAMVTLKAKNDSLHIGLIATAPEAQGKGYGKQLINKTLQVAKAMGLPKIEVPTQYDNKQACGFYEACGFRVKSIRNIYHFWL